MLLLGVNQSENIGQLLKKSTLSTGGDVRGNTQYMS